MMRESDPTAMLGLVLLLTAFVLVAVAGVAATVAAGVL